MYEVRKYDEKDKEQVVELWKDICIGEHKFTDWEEELQNLILDDYNEIIVAIYDNRVIGTIAYKQKDANTAELKRVYVRKEHREKGIAKILLDEVIKRIRENGYRKIFIETWEKFISGRRFYEKNNFILQEVEGSVYSYMLELKRKYLKHVF